MTSADPLAAPVEPHTLCAALDAALPQTQCTRCGYPDCHAYAQAMAHDEADTNRCPPGGAQGIARLGALLHRAVKPLDPVHGHEGPRLLAVIDEAWCIGCTLCIKACPVDCIVGASKQMHTVIDAECTGCELCVPACPVDCIALVPITGSRIGWDAWSPEQAQASRQRYDFTRYKRERDLRENDARLAAKAQAKLADLQDQNPGLDAQTIERKHAVISAALARAKRTP